MVRYRIVITRAFCVLALLSLITVSCTRDTFVEDTDAGVIIREFDAVFADTGTKTSLVDSKIVEWELGDRIHYYSNNCECRDYFLPEGGSSVHLAFETKPEDRFIAAVYGAVDLISPQESSVIIDGIVRQEQSGAFNDAHVSVAFTNNIDSGQLLFYNLTSILSFSLQREDIDYVLFKPAGSMLSGQAKVSFVDGVPEISGLIPQGNLINSIKVYTSCKTGEFFIAMFPGTMKGGFELEFYNTSNRLIGKAQSSKELSLHINTILDLGVMDSIIVAPHPIIEAVDMGLSVKWASLNLGASSPEEYGDFYAWGETESKEYYYWSDYKWNTGGSEYDEYNYLTKYNTRYCYGEIDNQLYLSLEDDAAHVRMGGKWHIPSSNEWKELIDNSVYKLEYMGDKRGVMITSTITGNSIFLPINGSRGSYDDDFYPDYTRTDAYWTSTLDEEKDWSALCVSPSINIEFDTNDRAWGMLIRPVYGDVVIPPTTDNGQDPESPESDSHVKAVDLGLSVKWASCNVGATAPEEYGNYYAWGETEPKECYDWSTYKWFDDNSSSITKYLTDDEPSHVAYLEAEDDVAHMRYGDHWRMPTLHEWTELNSCKWTWTTCNGVAGYEVTGTSRSINNNSIFLPAAGFKENYDLYEVGGKIFYWIPLSDSNRWARVWRGYRNNGYLIHNTDDFERARGLPIRAVFDDSEPSESIVQAESIRIFSDGREFSVNNALEITIGESVQLEALVFPENASDKTVTWKSDPPHIASVTKDGRVIAKRSGSCYIKASISNGVHVECIVKVNATFAGHGAIDLGLSVLWAGNDVDIYSHFKWGETEPFKNQTPYKWIDEKYVIKYNMTPNKGSIDNKTVLDPEDDAASVIWGGGWRMPTKAEWEELLMNCECKKGRTTYFKSRKAGYTDAGIVFDCWGYLDYYGNTMYSQYDFYWSSSLCVDHSHSAWGLVVIPTTDEPRCRIYEFDRERALKIRPVRDYPWTNHDN